MSFLKTREYNGIFPYEDKKMADHESHILRTVAVASIGGGLELYDFSIYVFFAPILAGLFFPQGNSSTAMLETFAIFAVGYFSRPLGGILFGHYGDKIGRRKGLIYTILLMALSTACIGLLPTYHSIGILAPLLLVMLRFLQGIAVGGDLPGAVTFVAEYASDHRRGLLCGFIYCGVNVGLLLASGIGALLTGLLTHEQLIAWGWRLGFILGIAVGAVGFYLRSKLADTPYFNRLEQKKSLLKVPLLQLFGESTKPVLQGIGLVWLFAAIIAQLFLYMPTYLNTVSQLKLTTALIMNSINILLFSICIPLVGHISDKVGRKPIIVGVALLFIVISYPLYTMINMPSLIWQMIALNCFGLLAAGIVGVMPATLAELFPTNVRYSGIGVSYNIGFAIFASITPMVATVLLYHLHAVQVPSYNLIVSAIVALLAAMTLKDRRRLLD